MQAGHSCSSNLHAFLLFVLLSMFSLQAQASFYPASVLELIVGYHKYVNIYASMYI